jgi:hypothetical protein
MGRNNVRNTKGQYSTPAGYVRPTTRQESLRVLKYRFSCLYCCKQIREEKKVRRLSTTIGQFVDKYGVPISIRRLQMGYFHYKCSCRSRAKFVDESRLDVMLDTVLREVDDMVVETLDGCEQHDLLL